MDTEAIKTVKIEDFDGVRLPADFSLLKEEIERLEVRNDYVWVTAYPKCGTTWCQELVWLIANGLNYKGAETHLDQRWSFIEGKCIMSNIQQFHKEHEIHALLVRKAPDFIQLVNEQTERRFIKSHLPWDFLPRQITDGTKHPKIIHVIRNPKQVAVSYYHHASSIISYYIGNLDDYIDKFIEGKVFYGDYFFNILSYWKRRHLPNLLILTYEEMSSDLTNVIKKLSDFMGQSYTKEEIDKLVDYVSFEKMKANKAVNRKNFIVNPDIHFMRKGTADSYKTELTPEMNTKLDKWIDKNIKGTGLPYEHK